MWNLLRCFVLVVGILNRGMIPLNVEARHCPLTLGTENLTPNHASSIDHQIISAAAHRGNLSRQFFSSLRDLNVVMNNHYSDMSYHIGHNTFPLIVASDSEPGLVGVGTTYTLFLEDGSVHRIVPVGPNYEMYKSLAHMAVGLFSIVSPYFKSPQTLGWTQGLKSYEEKVNLALENWRSLNSTEMTHAGGMLNIVNKYISTCFEKGSVELEDFFTFTNEFFPYVPESIRIAGKLQVFESLPALQKWKIELGPKWREVYVLIPTVWAVSERNTRIQMFEELLDKDKISTNIIVAEGAKTIEEARTVLGRIIGDRALAEAVFGRSTPERTQLSNLLSSRKDLIQNACDYALNEYFNRSSPTVSKPSC